MRRWLVVLVGGLLVAFLTGCGSEEQRGMNKNKDKPVAPAETK